jgi:hypothetical protein
MVLKNGKKNIKEMQTSFFFLLFLANELPSLRISPPLNRAWLVAMGILSIVLLHTAF